MDYSLKVFCYYLIDNNPQLFNNFCGFGGQPPREYNYNINLERLRDYLRQVRCNEKLISFYINILSEIKIFNCERIKYSIQLNVNQLTELHRDGKKLFMILPDVKLKKSNFFYSLLTLHLLKINNIYVENIYSKTSDFLNSNRNRLHNIGIICDDVSYSGKQLSEHLNDTIDPRDLERAIANPALKIRFDAQPNTNIFLSLVAVLPNAQRLINGQFYTTNFISGRGVEIIRDEIFTNAKRIFSRHLGIPIHYDDRRFQRELKEKLNLYHHYYLENLDDGRIRIIKKNLLNLEGDIDYLDLSFVILFQKYPDVISTYPSLCGMNKINGDTISFNIDNLLRITGMSEREFINKVKDSYEIDLDRFFNNHHHHWFRRIRDLRYDEPRLLGEIGFLEKCQTSDYKRSLETLSEMRVNGENEDFKILQTLDGKYNDDPSVEIDSDYDNFCENKSIISFYKEINYRIGAIILNKNLYLLEHLRNFTDLNLILHDFPLPAPDRPTLNNFIMFLNENKVLPYDIMFNEDFQSSKKSNIIKKGTVVNKNALLKKNLFWILPSVHSENNKNPIDIVFYGTGALAKDISPVRDFYLPKQAKNITGHIIPAGTLIRAGNPIPKGTQFEIGTIFPAGSMFFNADSKKYYSKYLKYKSKYTNLKKRMFF